MKILCPKCGKVFTPSIQSMPEEIWTEVFRCELCNVRLKQFPRGEYRKQVVSELSPVSFKGVLIGVLTLITSFIAREVTGMSGIVMLCIAANFIALCIAFGVNIYHNSKEPLVAELYENDT